jgi:hypothetical protein
MTTRSLSLPKHWEDWANLVLGIWLLVSPWLLPGAGEEQVAMQNAVAIGFVLVMTQVATLVAFRAWEEWGNVTLGAWLVISPWALGIASPTFQANFVIVGALVLALSLYELWDVRRHSARAA